MPVKIRKLKAQLAKAGFSRQPGKDGDDAQPYQIDEVQNALKRLGGKR